MKICGIDDAGRGSMIGPLVIAGISIKKRNLKNIKFPTIIFMLVIHILAGVALLPQFWSWG